MMTEMILLSHRITLVRLIAMLDFDEEIGLYQLPGGKYIIGYTDNGNLYQDSLISEEDETAIEQVQSQS